MTDKEKSFISAVVYIHNKETSITSFLEVLWSEMTRHFEHYEIICVDDASTDKSSQLIRDYAKANDCVNISIVNMSYQQGLEASMNAGVDLSIGDFVFEFDSAIVDYPPELIMQVYNRSLTGFDLVAASNARQRISSSVFYHVFNRNSHLPKDLRTETFRILSRRGINRVHSMSRSIPYRKAIYANSGLKMETLIYTPTQQGHLGEKEIHYRFNTAFDSIVLFTNLAYKLAITLAFVMMSATLGGIVYTMIVYLLGKPVAGYTTMMLLIAAAFFGVFAILAIMIKYLSVLVNLIFQKQHYTIESVEKVVNSKF